MTEQEKEQILVLRDQGKGYKAIAKELGLNVGSISMFFKRLQENTTATYCLHCQKKLKQTKGHRQKKLCADECRRQYWTQNRESGNRKAFYTQPCQECGIEFTSYGNSNRKYCCLTCYQRSRGKEKEEGE